MNSLQPKIKISHLINIYGNKPRTALKMFREGETRDSILETTNHVVGVADVSLTINQGELFVVMGLSGSGKSTLIRCINRLINPTSGTIDIDGEDVAHVDERRMREIRRTKIAMVFQRFGLFPHKTVVENVAYGLKVQGLTKTERRQKALNTLEVVGLKQWADYFPASLSGGMQQRVGLARALATDADILLMDEAFSSLDPLIRREMQDELLRLHKELYKTIVFISHDIQEALKMGDRIAVMKDGYIVQVGTPEELVTQPANDYIRAFTQDVNLAQVIKTGSITRQTPSLTLDKDSSNTALQQMLDNELEYLYIVNYQGQPIGIVNKHTLSTATHQGIQELTKLMQTNFPKVEATTLLEDTFHFFQQQLPIAVVNEQGQFQGIIKATDILACIGRLSKDSV
jgi:glycine betaine/proline transport system ATP-binding protein